MNKKNIIYDYRALEEYEKLPEKVQDKFKIYINILRKTGYLTKPKGKKLVKGLYEVRVKMDGAWRGLYAYRKVDKIILLVFFKKKSNKTPIKEMLKALNRLRTY